jgi:hypothetical protein
MGGPDPQDSARRCRRGERVGKRISRIKNTLSVLKSRLTIVGEDQGL